MTTIAKDPAVMETDYLVLHERISRLIVLRGRLHPVDNEHGTHITSTLVVKEPTT